MDASAETKLDIFETTVFDCGNVEFDPTLYCSDGLTSGSVHKCLAKLRSDGYINDQNTIDPSCTVSFYDLTSFRHHTQKESTERATAMIDRVNEGKTFIVQSKL